MKKIIHFSKLFIPFAVLSVCIIASGLYVAFTRGINYGIDFKAGLIQEVRIAPPVIQATYTGPASVAVQMNSAGITLVVSGVGAENTTHFFSYAEYSTAQDMANALNKIEGVKAQPLVPPNTHISNLFANTAESSVLSGTPFKFHQPSETVFVSIDDVRKALDVSIAEASVKAIGAPQDMHFQIRVGDDGSDQVVTETISVNLKNALSEKFGEENIAVIKTDFIGARFSQSLASQSAILVLLTLGLILLYCTIRFKWDFALGAVLAIVHDALIMVAFVAWTQMEFSSITIAAILTIVGYSINDTIVVLDRVRENVKNPAIKATSFTQILDISQTEILGRTIITTVTTMLAVISLYIFTTGQMKDFALALLVGMVSGVYSTIFIAGAFIALVRKNWKPQDEEKHAAGTLQVTL